VEFPKEQIAIEKDGKCFLCTIRLSTVRGGHHVLYVADDGTIIKKEPLHRYKERIKRRNNIAEVSESNLPYQSKEKMQKIDFIRLFHGSPNPDFTPIYGAGRDYHDYGNAFYCTEDYESAAEWACLRKMTNIAYVYEYELYVPENIAPKVNVLDFDDLDPIFWLSALLQHRVNNDDGYIEELRDRSIALTEAYPTNCETFDIIFGWRADDRHFAIIRDFLNTLISLETAKKAILLGNLGKQIVIKSERAYTWLKNHEKPVKKTKLSGNEYKMWHDRFIEKDTTGRLEYDALANESRKQARELRKRGTTILDVLGW
jgi:hypothetical protein